MPDPTPTRPHHAPLHPPPPPNQVWLWPDPDKGQQEPRILKGHKEDILCVSFSPPNLVATGAYDAGTQTAR